ncbi:trifunctional serine/threonine-protein kinase/ATP-binding protein/sensor histidine kinase [Dulcicalothrix desertica]|nr:ATP-binding sensor histidine kinase [Dulcicalothrix desertica]TWH61895.1 putative ATPase [Dulcicalothrix desertica PCC 7102]
MVNVLGYSIKEQIYAGTRTLVYRAIREKDLQTVIIKLMRNEYPSFSEIVQFRNQYTIALNLDIPGIIKPYSLETHYNGYALVMEDFDGVSLKEWVVQNGDWGAKDKADFLSIAVQIATILDGLHRHHVIHKDIKPANILIHPQTRQIKLIDLSISSLLPRETQQLQNPNILEGTLGYISPEQTGRMNRLVDYRTDFYSLGVTFYELLTGKLPFVSNEPMELVHSHIAKQALPAHSINPEIPLVISNIIAKLMAKNAEDRYQSALGLKYDLENCLYQYKETGKIADLTLGQRDICDRFLIPEKLYGREKEVETLLEAFDRVSLGSTQMILVAGFSGIGKTAVVSEVHKPIVRQRGYFIKGKYDQFQRNIPFSAFVQSFRDFMGQLLSESDAQLQKWKANISAAVGENGQVIIEVIPELETIIGQQPPVPELSGNAAQNRFNLLFKNFIKVFTCKEHPLVIFLDDLQWADSASLKLIQLLMSERNNEYLLVIGAYRDNEVSPSHPFILTVDEMKKAGATVKTITLDALSELDINNLVADTLSCNFSISQQFAELVYQKTKGNPFFTTQFLKALYEDGLITFDFNIGIWQCDIARIRALAMTDDVVEFVALQLQKLPQPTQSLLKLAACIGNQFDLTTLSVVSQISLQETAANLWRALQEGLVLPESEIYKFYQENNLKSNKQLQTSHHELVKYRFLHDRVQQAAYSLIPDDKKQTTHLKIGQLLLNGISQVELEEKLFDIVGHFNLGINLITQVAPRQQLAQLNLQAAQKAKSTIAYVAASSYLAVGKQLLEAEAWKNQYELTLAIYEEDAEVSYLLGNFDQMEENAQTIIKHSKKISDQVRVYEIKIQAYVAQNQSPKAINAALYILNTLGIQLPTQPSMAQVLLGLVGTKIALAGKPVDALVSLPRMNHSETIAATRLLFSVVSAAYISSPKLMALLVFKNLNLCLKMGNHRLSAFGYVCYALILCGILGNVQTGYQFGELSLKILQAFNAKEIECKVIFMVYAFIKPWKNHVNTTLDSLLEAYQAGINSGDIEYASWSVMIYCQHLYLSGFDLIKLENKLQIYHNVVAQLKQSAAQNYIDALAQLVLNLKGNSQSPHILKGEVFDETEKLNLQIELGDKPGVFFTSVFQSIARYLFGEYQQALESADVAKKYAEAATSTFILPNSYFYDSLICLALFNQSPPAQQKQLMKRAQSNQKKLHKVASTAPMNHLHQYYLVEAERHRVLGQKFQAITLYDRAISLAKENEYLNIEALANELAAKLYLDDGREQFARVYITNAYYCYGRWGAKAKVDDLEKRYPELLSPVLKFEPNLSAERGTILINSANTIHSTSTTTTSILDLPAVIKASQTISSEIQLDNLLATLMQVVIENAGAKKAALLLHRDNNLVIEVIAQISHNQQETETKVLQSIPIAESLDIPHSIIYYVKNTLETLVIDHATAKIAWIADDYIQREQPRSILCTPIINQGNLTGILYLENRLITGAFTTDRIQLLNLLVSQVAISLENARLYKQAQDYATQAQNYAQQLEQSLSDLKQMQLQLVQNEKMSALGNLVAGVAHEINNPVGFIAGNIEPALDYVKDVFGVVDLYQEKFPNPGAEIKDEIETINLEYVREDLPKLLSSMKEGVKRIRSISNSLRTFSRADTDIPVSFNIHDGIDSTILILKHRLKASENRPAVEVITDYGQIPQVQCFPGQLNQVFMNLLANAIDALEESNNGRTFAEIKANANRITVKTSVNIDEKQVTISIKDNGKGISESVKERIFDHLFTTKSVGKGTGLGLAIAHQIVVEKHGGTIKVNSAPGEGAEFMINLPVI